MFALWNVFRTPTGDVPKTWQATALPRLRADPALQGLTVVQTPGAFVPLVRFELGERDLVADVAFIEALDANVRAHGPATRLGQTPTIRFCGTPGGS